jgi:hypothetical protein
MLSPRLSYLTLAALFGVSACRYRAVTDIPPRPLPLAVPAPAELGSITTTFSVPVEAINRAVADTFKAGPLTLIGDTTQTFDLQAGTVLFGPGRIRLWLFKVEGKFLVARVNDYTRWLKKAHMSKWERFRCAVYSTIVAKIPTFAALFCYTKVVERTINWIDHVGTIGIDSLDALLANGEHAVRMPTGLKVILDYRANLRGVRIAKVDGDSMEVSADIGYAIRGRGAFLAAGTPAAECGYAGPSSLRATLRFRVSVISDSLRVTNGRLIGIEDIDKCPIGPSHFSAINFLKEHGNLAERVQQKIDKRFEKGPVGVSLKDTLDGVWNALGQNLRVAVKQADTAWLQLRSTGLLLSSLHGHDDTLSITAGVLGRPVLAVGSPRAPVVAPRPPLNTGPVPSVFTVRLSAGITLERAGALLTDTLRKSCWSTAFGTFRASKVEFYGVGDSTIIKLQIESPFRGRLLLVGRPVYDTLSNTLRFEQLDWSLESASVIANTAAWLGRVRITQLLREQLVVPLDSALLAARNALDDTTFYVPQGAADPVGQLRLRVTRLQPLKVFTTATHFVAFIDGSGTAEATIRRLRRNPPRAEEQR